MSKIICVLGNLGCIIHGNKQCKITQPEFTLFSLSLRTLTDPKVELLVVEVW